MSIPDRKLGPEVEVAGLQIARIGTGDVGDLIGVGCAHGAGVVGVINIDAAGSHARAENDDGRTGGSA